LVFILQKAIVMSPSEPTMEMFADHLHYSNPFDENRVTQTDLLINDVPAIHADAFDQLTSRAVKAVQNDHMGYGVVVTGPPGVGKSHLLARFGDWARREKYPFVYLLNLQAGPNDILRTILKTSISILTKGMLKTPGQTRLYRMVSASINHALTAHDLPNQVDLKTARQAYFSMRNFLDGDPSIYNALWELFADVFHQTYGHPTNGNAERAKRLLSGGILDPDEARQLKVNLTSNEDGGCSLDVEQLKEVLKVLCQFSGFRQRSFILCFDQVDTLTEEQVQSWSATTHALLDVCPRLMVVTSGVDDTFIEWTRHKLIPQSSWDRIRQYSISLSGIDADAAVTMVQDRLQASLALFTNVSEIQQLRDQDSLFPLGENWSRQTLFDQNGEQKSDLRPRTVINQAAAAWDREAAEIAQTNIDDWLASWPHTAATTSTLESAAPLDIAQLIDVRVADKLEEHRQSRLLRPEELPVDAGNVAGLLTSILKSCESADAQYKSDDYSKFAGIVAQTSKTRKKQAFQFIIEHNSDLSNSSKRKLGIAIAEASGGNAATNLLKRIITELESPNGPDRAILIVDGREPLQLAETGQSYLDKLKSMTGRFTLETLDFEQYALLDAYEAVVGLARSGDLEAALPGGLSRPINEAEVYESHHRNQRYLTPPILCQLVGKCIDTSVPSNPQIDIQRVLEAIYAQLAINSMLTTLQLANTWIEHQQPRPSESSHASVHNLFKEVVLKLHAEGKVFATALNDYYTVQPTPKLLESTP
jgi:hypothetical protein